MARDVTRHPPFAMLHPLSAISNRSSATGLAVAFDPASALLRAVLAGLALAAVRKAASAGAAAGKTELAGNRAAQHAVQGIGGAGGRFLELRRIPRRAGLPGR